MTSGHGQEEEGGPASWVSRLPWLRLLAEFGVIFLGITLSLMADDWRQSRIDREAERHSLQEVLADLTADSANLDDLRRHMARHDRDAAWLYSRLGEVGVNADSAVVQIRSLHDAPRYQARSAAYVGIRSTGQLGLIRDDALRREIVEYYEEWQPYILGLHETYGDIWFTLTETVASDLEFSAGGAETFADTFGGGRVFRLARPWTEIPTDPMLGFRLSTLGVLAYVLSDRASAVLGENADLRASIRDRLRR